ncbi:transcriptional regulator, MucR family [Sulfitobacter marinus]|uniref:Transcriptional regulator, MucR family n=1 Tax=Sulfitobacter marinus TaxID=394264 RepID=A0A1I6V690_9RHOB|nr:MucR family transcriptional regulator [Sulfitobacter marinus]SFT09136.1 transcriptional regulator, MucR family [Sulfitobacter marinus]
MPTLINKNSLSESGVASIAAGFASRSDVSIDDIVTLVERLMAITPGSSAQALPKPKAIPAVPAEQKMTDDTIFCLCCGKGFKMLKRHLGAEHGLTEAEYRVMFDLPPDTPLVAPSYSRRKAEYAKNSGLGKYNRDKSGKNAEIS